jgi:osmotically-inducible protein OsmY
MAKLGTGMTLLLGAAAGAAAQYFLDTQAGRRRREAVKARGVDGAKSTASGAVHKIDVVAGQAKGKVSAAMPHADLGDAGLARKVESEIFRSGDAPKGQVDVNAENGVVFLRGEVDREWVDRLGTDAEHVRGVKAVRNLLHPPGTPAPVS